MEARRMFLTRMLYIGSFICVYSSLNTLLVTDEIGRMTDMQASPHEIHATALQRDFPQEIHTPHRMFLVNASDDSQALRL